jgi:threonine dehydrogenase-like Zn-dependent dehydrogenase
MNTMQASVLSHSAFEVRELERPSPGPGEVLVKVLACGICGSDLHFFRHQRELIEKARALGAVVDELERAYDQGVTLGHEFVGEVIEFGPETARALAIGDRVVSMPFVMRDGTPALIGSTPELGGAYAQYMLLTEATLLRVDDQLPTEAAAFVEPLGIAVHAVNKSGIGTGDVAVVVGAGPIGLTVTATLRARGIDTIIASDLSPRRRDLAAKMGATVVVDGAKESAVAAAATNKPGARVVIFENTGAPGMLNSLVLEAPQNAHITVTGIAAGEESFMPMLAITKELSMNFVIYYTPEEFAEALTLLKDGKLDWRTLHTGTVGLHDIPDAFTELANPETHAKILIDPWLD